MIIENPIIKDVGRNFLVIELAQEQFDKLPEYSIAYPKNRPVGDVGKISDIFPGQCLIDIKENEKVGRIMHYEIKNEPAKDDQEGRR